MKHLTSAALGVALHTGVIWTAFLDGPTWALNATIFTAWALAILGIIAGIGAPAMWRNEKKEHPEKWEKRVASGALDDFLRPSLLVRGLRCISLALVVTLAAAGEFGLATAWLCSWIATGIMYLTARELLDEQRTAAP